MGTKLNRGTLLSTLKELRSGNRPKVNSVPSSVQAICGNVSARPNKATTLKTIVEYRRAMHVSSANNVAAYTKTTEFKSLEEEYNVFIEEYLQKKAQGLV